MADRPNVLLFKADQQRHDWLSIAGLPVETPTIAGLADRGVSFANAVCPSPLCGPSRSALASGMAYDRCGVPENVSYPRQGTYYRRLRDEAGYHVMGCGKFDLNKGESRWGLDGSYRTAEWGFSAAVNNAGKWSATAATDGPIDPYTAYLDERDLLATHLADFERRREAGGYLATDPTPLPAEAYCDNWLARQGLRLLGNAPENRPWFLVVNFVGPHDPLDVTERMHARYREPAAEFPLPDEPGALTADQHQAARRNYAAMAGNIDRWVGRYLEALAERGEREETLVAYVSDHGDLLGDHGQWKKRAPYRASVGVPFVIDGPDVEPRGRVGTPATTLDVTATVLDYAGLDPTAPILEGRAPDSRSLRPYLEGAAEHPREVVTSGLGPWRLVRDERYKLVTGYDPDRTADEQVAAFFEAGASADPTAGEPLLFDLVEDPGETRNVAAANPDVVDRLGGALDRHLAG